MVPVTCFSCGERTPSVPVVCDCGRVYDAPHTDDAAVARFTIAMREKLKHARIYKGRGGWDDPGQCSVEDLRRMLLEHVAKGDPVDIANFAMMVWCRTDSNSEGASEQVA